MASPIFLPAPTYAEVSVSSTDKKTGKTKSAFNPVWLNWFLQISSLAILGRVDLNTQVTGVLPIFNGGTGDPAPVGLSSPLTTLAVSVGDFPNQTIELFDLGIAPGVYSAPTLSVDQYGRINGITAGTFSSFTFARKTANYTIVLADANGLTWIEMNLAGANTLTVPTNAAEAIAIGRRIFWSQYGAGQITITPSGGVTLRTSRSLTSRAQYSCGWLTKVAANEWYVEGDLT